MPKLSRVMGAADQDQPVDKHFDALMLKIQQTLSATSPEEATLKLSTQEVFERLQAFYPSATYDEGMVARALLELGYHYDDPYRDLNFVWLFK